MKTSKEMTTDELLKRMPARPWFLGAGAIRNASGDVDPPKDEIEEFILRAANSFESMREALRAWADHAYEPGSDHPEAQAQREIHRKMHAALAISEGKESGTALRQCAKELESSQEVLALVQAAKDAYSHLMTGHICQLDAVSSLNSALAPFAEKTKPISPA